MVALTGLSILAPLTTIEALGVDHNGKVRYPLPSADSVSIDSRQQVIVCRSGNEVYAFSLSCPHQNTAIPALPGNNQYGEPNQ